MPSIESNMLNETRATKSGSLECLLQQNSPHQRFFQLKHLNQVPLLCSQIPLKDFCLETTVCLQFFPYISSILCSQPSLTALSLTFSNHHCASHFSGAVYACVGVWEGHITDLHTTALVPIRGESRSSSC